MIPTYSIVIRDERMMKRPAVDGRRKIWRAVNRFLIAFAEGEKELVFLRETVVDTHRPGCIQDRVHCRKREVVDQAIIVSCGRGHVWFWYEFHDVLSDGAQRPT